MRFKWCPIFDNFNLLIFWKCKCKRGRSWRKWRRRWPLKQATSHHIVPDTYCVRVTAHSPSPPLLLLCSPPQSRQHLQVRRARLSGGSETDVPPAPLLLTRTKTHTLSCTHTYTHTLAAIQNRHQDPAGVTRQCDPELDPGQQHLRQERDTIGFSCDPPPPPSCLVPLSH